MPATSCGLLALQPGVTIFGSAGQGANGTNNLDYRSGSVNGGKSDQANVTLDGADVNDQNARTAFTTVLRVTLDSVEEFRSSTSNFDAAGGRGSGADVALVTKSGTNDFHGSLYEYRRGTETAANSFFSNRSGVPRAPLLINLFGGTAGGAIKKNKLFYFINYEGRRDRSSAQVTATVPTETLKQGIILYHDANKVLQQIGPTQIQQIDPAGIGIDPAALKALQALSGGERYGSGRRAQLHRLPVQRSGGLGSEYLHRQVRLQDRQRRQASDFLARQSAERLGQRHAAVPGAATEFRDAQ